MGLNYTPDEEIKFQRIVEHSRLRPESDNLQEYTDFAIKDELFGANLYFTDAPDYLEFVNYKLPWLMNQYTCMFRGVGQASYRLFNKAQRKFRPHLEPGKKSETLFHESIAEMLKKAQTSDQNLLNNYFTSFGAKGNDIATLAFLQHYGAPTPLIDWTYDINVAIFFALNDLTKPEFETPYFNGERKVGDFFSIYLMREDMPQFMINDYKKLSIHSKNKATYQTLKRRQIAHITEIYKNGKPVFFLQNNLRIIKQKGIFVYNNSAQMPLEEVFYKRSFMYYLVRSPKDETVFRSPIMCLNIHKSLANLIKQEIKKKGYSKASMFPDAKRLAQIAVPKLLS
ncbi:MAG: FRG domain-containing protein [Bacteroidota bacterium]